MTQLSFDGSPATGEAQGFRGPQVCEIAGITYRQLDYWTRTGLIRASVAEARGSGTQRLYSYLDLVEIKVIKQLLDGGVSLQRARGAIEYLREHLGEELASANLVIEGSGSVVVLRTDGEIVDLIRRGQGVLNIVPLAAVREELDARIHELRPSAGEGGAGDAGGTGDSAGAGTRTASGGS